MSTYKILNITDQLGKRDANFESTLKIDYVDGMDVKSVTVKSNEIIYLTVPSLPLSLHRMRIKNWVTIDEIGKKELKKTLAKNKRSKELKSSDKKVSVKKAVTTTTTTKKIRTYSKKTTTKANKE